MDIEEETKQKRHNKDEAEDDLTDKDNYNSIAENWIQERRSAVTSSSSSDSLSAGEYFLYSASYAVAFDFPSLREGITSLGTVWYRGLHL